MQGTRSTTLGDRNVQCSLTSAQGAEIRHLPVQAGQPQRVLNETRRLAEGQAKQHLQREAELDCGIAEIGLTASLAGFRRMPFYLGIKPDR